MSDKAITAKIKVLLWNWRHCTRGRKLHVMAPWSDPGGKAKWERWACEESQAENQVHSPGISNQEYLIEAPRLHKSS